LESIEPIAGQRVIPYRAYRLDNGLTVYIHPDNRQPLVHVSVFYQVGSSYEEKGKSGFAHLFEHMMFQGSRHVSPNEHMKRVYDMGGKINGTTGRDLTHFFQTVPASYLETVLWLESDRMGFFVDGITEDGFAIQRDVVKSERAEHYDTQPYGLAPETIARTLYGDGHPYGWIPIGSMSDLDQSSATDLKTFFNTWYGPANAVLVIAGDVDPDQTIGMVSRYFSDIPKGPLHAMRRPWVPLLSQSKTESYVDAKATRPRISMVFPTVPAWHPDEAYLDAIAHSLGSGAASRLYPFIKNQRASDIEVYHATAALSGEFHVVVTPYEGEYVTGLMADIESVIDGLSNTPLGEDELTRYHRKYEMRVADTLSTLDGVASYLGTAHWLAGTAHFLPIEWAMNTLLTTPNARAVAQRYLIKKPKVYVSVYPSGNGATSPMTAPPLTSLSTTPPQAPIDRRVAPTPSATLKVPDLSFFSVTTNGIPVMGRHVSNNGLVSLRLIIDGGQVLASHTGYPAGSAHALARMIMQDSVLNPSEKLAAQLDGLGASMSIDAGMDEWVVSIRCLASVLPSVMGIVTERLGSPGFKDDDWKRVKNELKETIAMGISNPGQLADMAMAQMIYGQNDPLGNPLWGHSSDIEQLDVAQLKALHDKLFVQAQMRIAVVGDGIGPDRLQWMGLLRGIPQGKATARPALSTRNGSVQTATPSPIGPPQQDPQKDPKEYPMVIIVDMPGLSQSEVRMGYPAPKWDGLGPFFMMQLVNLPIGGVFNSRMNLKLREEKGMTYGAQSYLTAHTYPGYFEATTSVKKGYTADALADMWGIVKDAIRSGVTEEELKMIQDVMGRRDAMRYETLDQQVGLLQRIQQYGLPDDYLMARQKLIATLDGATLDEAASTLWGGTPRMVVVGDYMQTAPQFDRLGWTVMKQLPRDIWR